MNLEGIQAKLLPGTRTYVIRQSNTIVGVAILFFSAVAAVGLFAPSWRGTEHPVILWGARICFAVLPAILGFSLVTRRCETALDLEARTFRHAESWMLSSTACSGNLSEIESLKMIVLVHRGSIARNDSPSRTIIVQLIVGGKPREIFQVTERGTQALPGKAKTLFLPEKLGPEEFARRLSTETGIPLQEAASLGG